MGIGKTLSNILEENNSNPNELSERTGIPPSTIYSIIKRDNMKVDISVLARICKELGVKMERFYQEYFEEEKLKPNNICSVANHVKITSHELNVIEAYRNKPDMQPVVDKILDVDKEKKHILFSAARSENGQSPMGTVELTEEEYQRLINAPETDEDL